MKSLLLKLAIGAVFFLTVAIKCGHAQQAGPSIYVWNFSTRDLATTSLTRSLTDEFELALENTGKYTILERRLKERIEYQARLEQGITSTTQITPEAKTGLQLESAEIVVFGEVFDDVDSGQVSVTITFEDWKGEKRLIKKIDIPRGKINDGPTREEAMADLAKKIVGGNRPVTKIETHSFLIEITRCRAQGEDLTFDLLVTNTDDVDRNFTIFTDGYGRASNLFDDNGKESVGRSARIANHERGGYTTSLLISGVPVRCSIEFHGVANRATIVTRLFINGSYSLENGQNTDYSTRFSNIPIER